MFDSYFIYYGNRIINQTIFSTYANVSLVYLTLLSEVKMKLQSNDDIHEKHINGAIRDLKKQQNINILRSAIKLIIKR